MATVFTAKETPLRRYNQTGEKFESTMFDAEDENDTSFWSEASPDPRSDHPHEVDSNSMSISSLPSWGQLLMSPGPTTERTSSHGSKGVHWAAHSPSAIILEESEEEAPSAVVEEEDALSSSADSLEDRVQRLLHSNSTSMIKQYQQQHEEELRTTLMLIQEENKALHLEIEHLHERQNAQKLLYEQEMEAKEDQWKAKLEQLQRSHQEDRVKVERELTRRLEEHDAVQDCYKSLQEHHADLRNAYQKLQHETHELKAEIATQRESNQKEKNEKVSFEHQQQIIQSLKEELQRKEAELGRHQSELERIRERASSEELKAASTIGQLREQVERLTETLDKTQKQQKALRNTKERKSSNPVGVQTQESALLSSGAFDSDHLTDRVVRIRDAAERVQLERHYQHEIQQLKLQHAREMQSLKDAGMSNFLAPGNTEQLRAVRMEYTRELQKLQEAQKTLNTANEEALQHAHVHLSELSLELEKEVKTREQLEKIILRLETELLNVKTRRETSRDLLHQVHQECNHVFERHGSSKSPLFGGVTPPDTINESIGLAKVLRDTNTVSTATEEAPRQQPTTIGVPDEEVKPSSRSSNLDRALDETEAIIRSLTLGPRK